MPFAARDLKPRIGVEIQSDVDTLVSGRQAAQIRELLEQRGAIVFPRIEMTDEEQVTFAATLGGVIDMGEKNIFKVTLDPKESDQAYNLLGTFIWHVDGFSDDVPSLASMISARRLSPIGGQTEFANTYAAFDDLPEEKKQTYQKLRVVHRMAATQRPVYPNPTPEQEAAWGMHPVRTHPLVWTHRSGRKSLLLGSSADEIVGMDLEEGRALIKELMSWSTQPDFVYRHEWTIGDLVIWDNTGVMHRVEPYPKDSGRMMHRTTLVGEEAIA
jgi:alpha-ketoglutarate-dependent taurine dioxygenase